MTSPTFVSSEINFIAAFLCFRKKVTKMKLYIQRGDLDALKLVIVAKEYSISDLEILTLSYGELRTFF